MKKTNVFTTIGARNYALEDREENDFYATEPKAVELLYIIYVSKGVKKMKMDREGAVIVLYDIINSGIISDELELGLK